MPTDPAPDRVTPEMRRDAWLIDAACRDLVLRSARCVDAHDPDGFAALFTEDGVLLRPGAGPLQGRDAIAAAYRARPAGRITRHLVVGTLVRWLAPAEAEAHSQVLLWVGDADDPPGPQGRPARGAQVLGSFSDRLRLQDDGQWRIARREAAFELHAP